MKREKLWLTREQTDRLLEATKKRSTRDWLILELCRHGLRIGEIVGRGRLPGIHFRDLRANGVWLVGKGYSKEPPSLYELPAWLCAELENWTTPYLKKHYSIEGRMFDIGRRQVERNIKQYAKDAGIADYKLAGPHRLRAFFATDLDDRGLPAFTVRNMMRHRNINTTNQYVGRGTPEKRTAIMESLTPKAMEILPSPKPEPVVASEPIQTVNEEPVQIKTGLAVAESHATIEEPEPVSSWVAHELISPHNWGVPAMAVRRTQKPKPLAKPRLERNPLFPPQGHWVKTGWLKKILECERCGKRFETYEEFEVHQPCIFRVVAS